MNLVQINERLKDLPESVIRQYANGMNPEVPSYLALGELQRREMAQKRMAATQGGAQGPQPSVKEQIEQKAGLMALQQMQQQKMAQQMAQPRGPMPAPENVPQPQDQPETPMMAARGGLARIPVRSDMFEYAGGGIVAFASGGEVDSARANAKAARERLMSYGLAQRKSDPEGFAAAQQEAQAAASRLQAVEAAYAQEMGGSEATRPVQVTGMPTAPRPPARPAAPVEFKQQPVSEAQATMKAGPQAAVPVSGVKAAAEVKAPPRPPMAPPATPQGGLPTALPARSPYFAQVNADLAKPIAAPTPEGIIAEQRALSPEAMQEEFMKKRSEEQRQRAAGERAAFEKTRPSGLDDLIRVFGQAGQYKGLSGLAPAYTANQQQRRAEELAMEQRQNQLLTGIDKSEYDSSKELFGARTSAMKEANNAFQNRLKSRSEVLAQMAGVDQRAIDEALNRQTQVQIQGMRDAAAKLERSSPGKGERMLAEVLALRAAGKNAEADRIIETINALEGRGGREDTLGKEIAKKRVEAASLPAGKYKDQVLAGLDALEKGQGGGGGNQFTVTAGGKTYTFPTQEAANKFKAEAGVK
jgi:hypothetical protein